MGLKVGFDARYYRRTLEEQITAPQRYSSWPVHDDRATSWVRLLDDGLMTFDESAAEAYLEYNDGMPRLSGWGYLPATRCSLSSPPADIPITRDGSIKYDASTLIVKIITISTRIGHALYLSLARDLYGIGIVRSQYFTPGPRQATNTR